MKMRSPIEHFPIGFAGFLLALAVWPTSLIPAVAQSPSIPPSQESSANSTSSKATSAAELQIATFGGGCFWCVESVFENVNGVVNVVSGYAGGKVPNPTYEMVHSGKTGHAEVCQITYDPTKVTYLQLLEIFLKTHDPTSMNRQGPDRGTQYRSTIFYHSDEQKEQAQEVIDRLDKAKVFHRKILTQLEPYTVFFMAEDYHQDYFRRNPADAYCNTYTRPKLAKLRKVIKEMEEKEKDKSKDKDKEQAK